MRGVVKFFRANPQVFALFLICLVLGLGTFLAVVFGLISAGSTNNNGEPSGVIPAFTVTRADQHAGHALTNTRDMLVVPAV